MMDTLLNHIEPSCSARKQTTTLPCQNLYQLQCPDGTNAPNSACVVAATQNAEVHKLVVIQVKAGQSFCTIKLVDGYLGGLYVYESGCWRGMCTHYDAGGEFKRCFCYTGLEGE